jgi:hypothetical protein
MEKVVWPNKKSISKTREEETDQDSPCKGMPRVQVHTYNNGEE